MVMKRQNYDIGIIGLLAVFAAAQVISWFAFPWLAVTARLSTSPIVVVLCCLSIAAIHLSDWRLAKFLSIIAVPVMAAGRFTFHILGGAPPMNGNSLFEGRCILELLVLVAISVLCVRHETGERDGRMVSFIMMGFFTDALDTPFYSLKKIRCTELLLCSVSIALWIVGGYYGGLPMLSAAILVPGMMMFSGERNNKNLIALLLMMKMIADMGDTSYLYTQELHMLFIFFDCLALLMAVMGRREDYSLVLMMQIIAVFAGFILFCCASVDRNAPCFLRTAAAWGSELTLYSCYLLQGYGRSWSWHSIGKIMYWLFEPEDEHPDNDWKSVNENETTCTSDGICSEESHIRRVLSGYRVRKKIFYLSAIIITIFSLISTDISDASSLPDNSDSAEIVMTWSEDRTVAAHYDIFKEALYGQASELTYEKRLEFFKAAVDVESNYLCIPYEITVKTDKLNRGDSSRTVAQFNYSMQTITVDSDYLLEADPCDLVESAAHETYHAWQYEVLHLDEVVKDERARAFLYDQLSKVKEYSEEFKNYKSEGTAYYSQTVEREARSYAADSVLRIKERLQELDANGT